MGRSQLLYIRVKCFVIIRKTNHILLDGNIFAAVLKQHRFCCIGLKYDLEKRTKKWLNMVVAKIPDFVACEQQNNKGADQPAHSRRLISAFVVHYL